MSKKQIYSILEAVFGIGGYFMVIHYYDWKLAVAISAIILSNFIREEIKKLE